MDEDNYAQIIVHETYIDGDIRKTKLEFEWIGEPDWPFLVQIDLVRETPNILDKLPWPVEYVGKRNDWTLIYRRKKGEDREKENNG